MKLIWLRCSRATGCIALALALSLSASSHAQPATAESLLMRASELEQGGQRELAHVELAKLPASQRTAAIWAAMGRISIDLQLCPRARTELQAALASKNRALKREERGAVQERLRSCVPQGASKVDDDERGIQSFNMLLPKPENDAKADYAVVKIFFATDRHQNAVNKVDQIFDGARNATGALVFGTSAISIPRDHQMGELERPSIWRFEVKADPEKHITVLQVKPEPSDKFFSAVTARVEASASHDAFVFIHGYNVPFLDAARRTGQLAYDLGFRGAPILYSWPSRGSELGYLEDEASGEWSSDHLKEFLGDLSKKTGAATIHLIAHSMGAAVLARALRALGGEAKSAAQLFHEVVLVAPDIDAGVFRQLASDFHKPAKRVTIYASANDRAMDAAYLVRRYRRVGDAHDGVTIFPNIDSIDVSPLDASTFGLNHSYFGDKRTVISDLFQLLRSASAPRDRSDLIEVVTGAGSYFRFRR